MALMLFVDGCAKLNDDDQTSNIEEELLKLIDADEALMFEGLDDEGDQDEDYSEGIDIDAGYRLMGDTLLPGEGHKLRFGRRIDWENSSRDITFEINGDTAIGTVARTLVGTFKVGSFAIDTTGDQLTVTLVDSFSKDFTSEFSRKIRFVQVADSSDPDGYRWKVDALTMGIGGSGTKLNISGVNFYKYTGLGTDSESDTLMLSIAADTDGEIYFDRDNLPTFTHSFLYPSTYRVEVSVINDDPLLIWNDWDSGEAVAMHFGLNRHFKARRKMHDSGLFADATAGDNVFSRLWRPHRVRFGHNAMIARMFFSSVDNNTLFASDGGYNTSVWSFPYKVVAE